MSWNVNIDSGTSVRLATAGKYCDRDIIVTASEGSGGDSANLLDALIEKSITEVTSNATIVGKYGFYMCGELTSARFPFATEVCNYAFESCTFLASVDFPSATRIGNNGFKYCFNLTSVRFPLVTLLDPSAFYDCNKMTSADFPSVTKIYNSVFSGCSVLTALILRSGTICSLQNSNALYNCYHFTGTVDSTDNPDGLKDGYIYVPSALIEDYKVATNWATYADQFRAIEDYTVDGTVMGEMDFAKMGVTL